MSYLSTTNILLLTGCLLGLTKLSLFIFKWRFTVLSLLALINSLLALVIFTRVRQLGLNYIRLQIAYKLRQIMTRWMESSANAEDDNTPADRERVVEVVHRLRDLVLRDFIHSWWRYLSPESSGAEFLSLQRLVLTRLSENLAWRVRHLDLPRRTVEAVLVRTLSKSRCDPEQARVYLLRASSRIIRCLLSDVTLGDSGARNCSLLVDMLSEIVTRNLLVPLLDLISTPRVFFFLWLTILGSKNTVREYLNTLPQPESIARGMSMSNSDIAQDSEEEDIDWPDMDSNSIELSLNETVRIDHPTVQDRIIKDIRIDTTRTASELKSKNQFTLYCITYRYRGRSKMGREWSDIKVERRHREFINLHKSMERFPDYKGIRGPSTISLLTFRSMSPDAVNQRRVFLTSYLQEVITRTSLVQTLPLRRFLAVDGGANIAFEVESLPWDSKIINSFTSLIDRITPTLSTVSRDPPVKSDPGVSGSPLFKRRLLGSKPTASNGAGGCSSEEFLRDLSPLPSHRMPTFPKETTPECYYPPLESNLLFLRRKQRLQRSDTLRDPKLHHSLFSELTQPKIFQESSLASKHTFPAFMQPIPILLALRRLALTYRPVTPDWPGNKGPFLLQITPTSRKTWVWRVWSFLSCLADPIIHWHLGRLFLPGRIANYLELVQNLLWPDPNSPPSDLCEDVPLERMQLAARMALIEILPDITYLFVDRTHLGLVVDQLLKNLGDKDFNRDYILQLFKIVLEEGLFPDIKWDM